MLSEGGGAIGLLDYKAEERKLLAKRPLKWVWSTCDAVVKDILVEDEDDEQSKKMTSKMADVALQMSFKSEEETKKASAELKQKGVGNGETKWKNYKCSRYRKWPHIESS